jgi:hypothetical protein
MNTDSRGDRLVNAIAIVLGIPSALVLGIWMTWITWTAFAGGQAPYFPIEFDGVSIGRGLLWLIIIDPIVVTVAYWIFMLVMLPVIALAAGAGALADRRAYRKKDSPWENDAQDADPDSRGL